MDKLIRKRKRNSTPKDDTVSFYKKEMQGNDKGLLLLAQAQTCWQNLHYAREKRERALRMVYGDQWSDLITVDGKKMTQREYITSQGNVALQSNQLTKIVNTIVGSYVKEQNEPICHARDRKEQPYGEVMSTVLQANWDINEMMILLVNCMEEGLIGGWAAMRESYETREQALDCWTDVCNPNYIFWDGVMKDPRFTDISMVGEIHDITFNDLCTKFAKKPSDVERLKQFYPVAGLPTNSGISTDLANKHKESSLNWGQPLDSRLCRVYEIWTKESRGRYHVHDENTGELYKIDADDTIALAEIRTTNAQRKALAAQQGWSEDEIPLIHMEYFRDEYWYGRFLTVTGEYLWEGESPYEHGMHPYTLFAIPFTNGQITSYINDAIDHNIYINRMITLHDWMIRSNVKGVTFIPKTYLGNMKEEEFAKQWTSIDGIVFYEPDPSVPEPKVFHNNTGNIALTEIVRLMSELMDSGVAVNQALRGEGVKSGTASSLYQQMTQNSATPLASFMLKFNTFVKKVATKKLSFIQQFYEPSRYEEIAGSIAESVINQGITLSQTGNIQYDLAVKQSTASPVYRMIKQDTLEQLLAGGAITVEDYLEETAIPGLDGLLQKIQARMQTQQEAQQGMAMGQPQLGIPQQPMV